MIDLKAKKIKNVFEIGSLRLSEDNREQRLREFALPAVSPDGKYVFCVSDQSLHRLKVMGDELIYEEGGARIASNARRVEISPDSKYVALPSGGGNEKGYVTHVYRVTKLTKPILKVKSGAYPQALSMDRTAGLIYTQDHQHELKTFNTRGLAQKSYDLFRNGSAHQFLVHPDGHRMLVLCTESIVAVKLPGASEDK